MLDKFILGTVLVSLSVTIGIIASSIVKPTARLDNSVSEQGESKPRETPVPFQPTKENKGARCDARVYFGLRPKGSDEGYTASCYKLQSRLIEAARRGDLGEIREALRYGANANLPVDDSFPPLQEAASGGSADATRLLLDN